MQKQAVTQFKHGFIDLFRALVDEGVTQARVTAHPRKFFDLGVDRTLVRTDSLRREFSGFFQEDVPQAVRFILV
jgi:hypothetical protein